MKGWYKSGWENLRPPLTTMSLGPHMRNPNLSKRKATPRVRLQFDPEDEIGCFKCGSKGSYNFEFDSNYCATCNEWLEGLCKDATCPFCPTRPKYPKYPE